MVLGRRKSEQQQDLFVMTTDLPKSVGHVFYTKLDELLAEAGFDRWVEDKCESYDRNGKGRPGIAPGVYFRMLLVGYFEGIQSQRGIAWRCAESLSLRSRWQDGRRRFDDARGQCGHEEHSASGYR